MLRDDTVDSNYKQCMCSLHSYLSLHLVCMEAIIILLWGLITGYIFTQWWFCKIAYSKG